jgi:hypothetical protein
MNQQRQTQQGPDESGGETTRIQQTMVENGRLAMRQFVELPLQFQRSAAELFMNGLETQKWAQERGIELTRDTVGSYLETLDSVVQNAEEMAQTEMAATQRQGQTIQQGAGQFETGGRQREGRRMNDQRIGDQRIGGPQMRGPQMKGRRPVGGQGQPPQQPAAQQSQEIGQQASAGEFQGRRPIQQPRGAPQQPQRVGRRQPSQIGEIRQPLTQQPSTQQPPVQQRSEQPTQQPEPAEATRLGSNAEGRRSGPKGEGAGRSDRQESLTETQ